MIEGYEEITKTFILASVATWGITEAVKPMIKNWTSALQKTTVRIFALACGASWGACLVPQSDHMIAGVCGAALSTTVVALIKSILKRRSE